MTNSIIMFVGKLIHMVFGGYISIIGYKFASITSSCSVRSSINTGKPFTNLNIRTFKFWPSDVECSEHPPLLVALNISRKLQFLYRTTSYDEGGKVLFPARSHDVVSGCRKTLPSPRLTCHGVCQLVTPPDVKLVIPVLTERWAF